MALKAKGLLERLQDGETVVCAEGYLFAFERRGYLKAGAFVPEIVLEHPELVRQQYEEFVHAGSDVVLAFTYYAHRAKLALIDREKDIVKLNRDALRIAREVAEKTGTLMAGNISNTTVYNPEDPEWKEKVSSMYKEQVEWAVEANADFMVAETISALEEALIAVKCIKTYGKGMPAVVTLIITSFRVDGKIGTADGVELSEALRRLEAAGADVVGLNCSQGPTTMLPLLENLKGTTQVPLAAVPAMYRTSEKEPNFLTLTDPRTGDRLFPLNLDCMQCTRDDVFKFGQRCKELGIQYVGLCCGNSAHLTRSLAESIGRSPPASRYSPDMSQHFIFGTAGNEFWKEIGAKHIEKNMDL